MRRRAFVGFAVLGCGGCLGSIRGGCGDHEEIDISARRVTLDEEEWQNVLPIRAASLPADEREVLVAAIEDEHVECYPGSEPLQSLLDRIREAGRDQKDGVDGTLPRYLESVYAVYDETRYVLFVRVQDGVISGLYP